MKCSLMTMFLGLAVFIKPESSLSPHKLHHSVLIYIHFQCHVLDVVKTITEIYDNVSTRKN